MEIVILEWTYEPVDSFGDRIDDQQAHYHLTIEAGAAEARIDAAAFDRDPSLRQTLHSQLDSDLRGVQLSTHKPYSLSNSRVSREEAGRPATLFTEPGSIETSESWGSPELQGSAAKETRQERHERERALGELIQAHLHKDSTLKAILDSYQAAVTDPGNELAHLYEIREALGKKFGGENGTCSTLGVSKHEWSRLGSLANGEPLRQGRHRGSNAGDLRDATQAELKEVRDTVRKMIVAYLGTFT